jgi:hypothetical protein
MTRSALDSVDDVVSRAGFLRSGGIVASPFGIR